MSDAETENDKTWTTEEFRPYVRRALDRWKRGALFMRVGLSESEAILSTHGAVPDKDDKDHPYNKLLEVIVKDVVAAQDMDKKAKRSMAMQLRSFHDEWAGMIKTHKTPVKSKPTTADAAAAEAVTETAVEPAAVEAAIETPAEPDSAEETAEPTTTEDAEIPAELQMEDTAKLELELPSAVLAKMEAFEKEKKEILDSLPDEVKARFGQQYFSKWGKNILPCVVMSPFDIPPSLARDQWLKMYEKVKKQERLSAATNLVYWYGSHEDPQNAYSLISTSKLILYENGTKKGHDKVSKATQKKLDAEKPLTSQETMFVVGVAEMKKDLTEEPSDRRGYLDADFLEDWQYVDEEEDLAVVEAEPKPKKSKKRKKEDDADSKRKQKKATPKKGEKKEEEKTAPKPEPVPTAKVGEIEDIGDDDISSHDDKDDLEDAEDLPSESDEDDEDFEHGQASKTAKKKKAEAKKPPRKKGEKAKTKIERKRKGGQKKVSENERKRKLEQQRFTQCEEKYLKIITDWKYGLENQSKGTINEIYGRLLEHVSKFSATFIEVYEMSNLMKRSKKIVDNANRIQLWKAMKEIWMAKRKDVPEGFLPQKRQGKEQSENEVEEATQKPAAAENMPETDSSKKVLATPIKKKATTESQESSAPQKPSTPIVTEKKKKFSLGSIMTKPKPTAAPKVAKAGLARTSSSSQLSRQNDRPIWISEATSKESPSDENRSFALEFLQQAAPFIPSNDIVNHDAIARELEVSIYNWAGGKDSVSTKQWLGKYWEKIDDLVAAISGNGGSGTIALMISQGRFRSAADVVKLSENDIACSFEGRPLEDYNWS